MSLLHEYQVGTSYRRGEMLQKSPEWGRSAAPRKSYADAGAETLVLARPKRLLKADLWELLRKRRSRREYSGRPMAQESLFLLLWAAQGMTTGGPWALRTAPSAGALYPVETYV
ncbi:MAG: nitroreductase family protein, partial [Phycisphaerae bacterium]